MDVTKPSFWDVKDHIMGILQTPERFFCLFLYFIFKPFCVLFTDFSDRISKSKRVGYESGEFEIVSTFCSAEIHYVAFYYFRRCSIFGNNDTIMIFILLNKCNFTCFLGKLKSLGWCCCVVVCLWELPFVLDLYLSTFSSFFSLERAAEWRRRLSRSTSA